MAVFSRHRTPYGGAGSPCYACNLLKAGYSLTVHNRTKAKSQQLLAEGATWGGGLDDIAKDSVVVISCATDTPDVREVLLGENSIIEAARGGLSCFRRKGRTGFGDHIEK